MQKETQNTFSFFKRNSEGLLMMLLLIATLLPLFILSLYTHPALMDDYNDTNMVFGKGFFGVQKFFYLNWTGRYFTDILLSLNPLVFHAEWAYKFNSIVWLSLHLIAAYWLCGKLFKGIDWIARIGIVALFLFTYIMLLPDITGVFWQTCLYVNFTPNFLTLFLFGCMVLYYQSEHKNLYFILSALLMVAIIGSYETCMIYIDMFMLLFAVVSFIKKKKLLFPFTLLVIAIAFSVFSATAPGNKVRAAMATNTHQFIYSLKESLIWGGKVLLNFHWLLFTFFIGLLLFGLLANRINWNNTGSVFILSPSLALLASLAIPFAGMFIYFYSSGTDPPPRTVNSMWFYFLMGMMYFSFTTIAYIKRQYPNFNPPAMAKPGLYIVLALVFFFRAHNITQAYKDVSSGVAVLYDKERTERNIFLTTFKGDSCLVDSIQHIPKTLYFVELPEKINWLNTSYWDYYHKKYIGIKDRVHHKQ